MNDDAMQGMLFGSLTDEDPAPSGTAGDQASGQVADLRLCALNVNNPSPPRAQHIMDWLLTTNSNALVLTELRPTDGCRLLTSGLAAEGFDTHLPSGWADSTHFTLVATRGVDHRTVTEQFDDPRTVAVDLISDHATVRLVGLYGPTNGMTNESSQHRRTFQKAFLEYLATVMRQRLIVAGDLNVVEPGHQPHLEVFQEHDYDFYRALIAAGLNDAYRALHPTAITHSWISDRFGAQRLDHVLTTPAAGTLISCHYDTAPRTAQITDHASLHASLTWTTKR